MSPGRSKLVAARMASSRAYRTQTSRPCGALSELRGGDAFILGDENLERMECMRVSRVYELRSHALIAARRPSKTSISELMRRNMQEHCCTIR